MRMRLPNDAYELLMLYLLSNIGPPARLLSQLKTGPIFCTAPSIFSWTRHHNKLLDLLGKHRFSYSLTQYIR
jgi:hypothetical protein